MRCLVLILILFLGVSSAAHAQSSEAELAAWGEPNDPSGRGWFETRDGSLVIMSPGPKTGLSVELGNMDAPRVMRTVQGDFTYTVKVTGNYELGDTTVNGRKAFAAGGILVMADERNYIRFEKAAYKGNQNTVHYGNFELRVNGKPVKLGSSANLPLVGDKPAWLKLERKGAQFQAIGRIDGDRNWRSLGSFNWPTAPQTLRVGVAATSASTKFFAAEFSDQELVSSP